MKFSLGWVIVKRSLCRKVGSEKVAFGETFMQLDAWDHLKIESMTIKY